MKKTQGRKGERLLRINMGFSDENHEYLKRKAKFEGKTLTECVNELIDKDRAYNSGLYNYIDETIEAKKII